MVQKQEILTQIKNETEINNTAVIYRSKMIIDVCLNTVYVDTLCHSNGYKV